jgi:hypothetical protein
MSFRLSKNELLERKQRWRITNVLEKQKINSLDIITIVYLVRYDVLCFEFAIE